MNESTIDRQTGWQAGKQARRHAGRHRMQRKRNVLILKREEKPERQEHSLPLFIYL